MRKVYIDKRNKLISVKDDSGDVVENIYSPKNFNRVSLDVIEDYSPCFVKQTCLADELDYLLNPDLLEGNEAAK